MVCIACIVVPVLLWVYHRFLRPIVEPLLSKFLPGIFPSSQPTKSIQETESPPRCPLSNGNVTGDPAEKKDK